MTPSPTPPTGQELRQAEKEVRKNYEVSWREGRFVEEECIALECVVELQAFLTRKDKELAELREEKAQLEAYISAHILKPIEGQIDDARLKEAGR